MSVWRATWTITHPSLGGTGTNTWHARVVDDPILVPDGFLNDANTVLGAFYTEISSIFAGGAVIAFNGEWVRVDDNSDDIVSGDTNSLTVTGSADPLPPATCMCVGWRTSTASKRARGRTFLGPLSVVTLQDNGTPTEAARTTVEDAADTFVDSFDGSDGFAFAVWSVVDSVARDITRGRVANRFASLRSRRD